ncbi:hypothetical protein BDP81DRAFT_468939 [Colletotrichum phormii]|uniref:Uncharacterized protein n=1 Tax=Colletotrichum phormii TaxID=359342 RepID=A0AAJ0A0R1_9PEZI|nr:uncharacterized protein BDP81DRAFT_468939 [Colletotrichum phormii]KAK1640007.1 hypothetical protein BDP81DRAFT_468939 [Colletotrichum phormii]
MSPHINYSNHPNVKALPGLDFGVGDGVPILNRRHSGLFRRIVLPQDASNNPRSAQGTKSVASRLQAVFQAAIRTYEENDGVPTMRNLWTSTFEKLRLSDKTWDFDISYRNTPVIIYKITAARSRFLNSDADKSSIPAEFFEFLHTIDTFILKVESSIGKNKSNPLKKKRPHDDETEESQHALKRTRVADVYEDIEKKTKEEQIQYWKETALGLKKELEGRDEAFEGLNKLLHEMKHHENRSNLELNNFVSHLWDEALPQINSKQRQQGKAEWASSQLQRYLRATGSSNIADAMLGICDFADREHM